MTFTARSHRLTLALLLAGLLSAGCAHAVKSLGEVSKLHVEIVKEYGEKDVGVNLNNDTSLTITFVNSTLNDGSREERAKRAEQTAAFVTQHYSSINQLTEIWVGFVRMQTRFIVLHYSESLEFFEFDKNGRSMSRTEDSPAARFSDDSMRPRAVYSTNLKQTDVIISSLQLQGNANQGLALTPHFTVSGDATGVRRSSSFPQSVSFDFSSYSEKSLFPGMPKIVFLADGKAVYETSAQFSTSKNPDGLFFESLALLVPYPAFRRMTIGKDLTLRMGDQEYKFTDEQVAALREMTQYVKE